MSRLRPWGLEVLRLRVEVLRLLRFVDRRLVVLLPLASLVGGALPIVFALSIGLLVAEIPDVVRAGFDSGAGHRLVWILDAYTEHAIFERFARASDRAGGEVEAISLLISHRFSTVRMADLVVVLEGGAVAQVGTHEDLERQSGPYRELYELQSRAYR